MEIKIRPPAPVCSITLSRHGWLEVLSFLNQTAEQAASDETALFISDHVKTIRSYVLSKEVEATLNLDREPSLDFYLHLQDFKDTIKDQETRDVISSVARVCKNFLVGEDK